MSKATVYVPIRESANVGKYLPAYHDRDSHHEHKDRGHSPVPKNPNRNSASSAIEAREHESHAIFDMQSFMLKLPSRRYQQIKLSINGE